MSHNNRYTKAEIRAQIKERKRMKALALQRNVTVFALLIMLVLGLVSTTFSAFVAENTGESGTLVADIQTLAVNQGNKDQVASLGANADLASTSATITGGTVFYIDVTNWGYSDARYAAYFCNGTSSSTWVDATKISNTLYSVTVPSGQSHANIIWCRMNGSTTSNSWTNVWNQTADLVWDGTNNLYTINGYSYGTWSKPSFFNVGDVVYFDIRNNTSWLTADSSSQMYIQFNSSTTGSTSTSNRAQLTRIGTYLYMYEFTSLHNGSVRFWRGNSSNMWNYSKSLSAANGNGVYIASGGWNGSGTEATFSLTSLSAPSLTLTPNVITLGESTVLSSSSTSTLSYKIGSTTYTTNTVSGDLKYTFKNGSTALNSASTATSYTWTPSAAGTYSTYVTITSTATGLTATSSAQTLTVKAKYTYVISANTGGTVRLTSSSTNSSSISGSVTAGEGVSITATPNSGYTFVGWTSPTKGNVDSATSTTTTFTPTATGASVKASFRPDAPSALTLTGSPVVSGAGTDANPYIVFNDNGFTLTANATVVSGASKYYTTTAPTDDDSYSTTYTFKPFNSDITTKGVDLSYIVYAKAYAGGYYSTNYKSATAYYMVFSHLDGANTGFTMSSDKITDAESVTFSGAYVNGVADAEKAYITQSYQISTDNSTFSDITGSSWTPNAIGTYYFRLKTTNTKTGEVVYSTSKSLTVEQSTVYYPITVINDGTVDGTVTLKADGVTITDGQILSNSKLTVSVTRPNSNYYIEYLDVDTISEFDNMNVNGDITDYVAYDHVKGNVVIHYKLTEKPKVTVSKPANSSAIQFAYYFDGVATDANAAGTYHVDYDTRIRYSVTPNAGYYVESMTGVTIGEITASTVVGAKNNVTTDIASVTATLVNNNTVTVNVDTNSAVTEGGTMTIDGTAHAFGVAKALNYGTESEIVITPPDGCYAFVSGNDITPAISTDGKSTFKVKLTGANKTYTVKFLQNPKIYMVQPQYGSVYVTDNDGNYYFNGDPVGYGTELTVNVKPDHANAVLSDVLVNDASIGTVDGSKFNITVDSTATATITVASDFSFNDNTAYGTRRVFFTDNAGWGNSNAGNVLVHCSNTVNDTDFTSGNIVMTRKYYNEYNQYVYYADIPFSTKYVTFVYKANTTQYSQQGTILNTNNAFYMDSSGNYPRALHAWNYNYSDYVAADRVDTIQQAVTSKGEPVTFQYTCDFGDDTLSAEKVAGNEVTYDFDRGTLSITPTQNTYSYSLVKVTSAASTTVKYYLIRVENFEIYSFTGLQKIYKANVLNDIQLDLILKGGILNYAADFFVSDTNATNSYSILEISQSSGFTKLDSIEGYINSFLIKYALSGVKYFRVDASDSANHKASAYMKTLFGTNTYEGERVLYFYNNTNVNIAKYNLRACFKNAGGDYVWATMQPVGNTNYYRAVIPRDYSAEVDFFLTSKKTFTYNRDDIINTDNTLNTEFCSYGVINVTVPVADTANIVYAVNSIDTNGGINGEFAEFDY